MNKLITVIEDEKGLVDAIKLFLEARGFTINCAYNGQSGLELVKKQRPDLIILDIMLPEMDGRDVLINLKKDSELKNIPVIILSARGEQFERDYGLKLGADEYIGKPYNAQILLRQINNILEKVGKDSK